MHTYDADHISRSVKRLGAGALTLALAVTVVSGTSAIADPGNGKGAGQDHKSDLPYLGSKHPYSAPASVEVEAAPAGYEPLLTQTVARHGSRGLSGPKYDVLSTDVFNAAKDAGALTDLGEKLGPAIDEITRVNEENGYGNLTGLGRDEHHDLGARSATRMQDLYEEIGAGDGSITLRSSGKERATESGEFFTQGVADTVPSTADRIPAVEADPETLYFHKSDPEYLEYEDNDPRLDQVEEERESLPGTKKAARHLLERLYTSAFVDDLEAGKYSFATPDGEDTVDNEVDAASMVYELYIISAGMSEEIDTDWSTFVKPKDAEWFNYLGDSEDFYEKGPGFAGEDATYRMAEVLRDDFVDTIEEHAASGEPGADLKFAHAEEIFPFAALLQLPPSTQQQPLDELFSFDNNPWRSELVAPMAANVQWDTFVDESGTTITRVIYNEQEVALADPCEPMTAGSTFYTTEELKECLPEIDLATQS